jgi:hypothetical protein
MIPRQPFPAFADASAFSLYRAISAGFAVSSFAAVFGPSLATPLPPSDIDYSAPIMA